jgi:hypothetical protein
MNKQKKTAIFAGSLVAIAAVVGIVVALTVGRPKPMDNVAAPGGYQGGGNRYHITP